MKKLAILLLLLGTLLLSACGQLFDREVLVVTDYDPPTAENAPAEDGVTVRDMGELRQMIAAMIDEDAGEGRVVFDASYPDDINADIASVCWQLRTQDALYAYCVENISYELRQILTHYEATISISYTEADLERDQIVRLQFSTGLEEQLRRAIAQGQGRLVVLIGRSRYTAEDVESLVSKVYREDPVAAPREPRVSVSMLSGTGTQRLYEIGFNYGMSPEELQIRRAALQDLHPFDDALLQEEPAMRALAACQLLVEGSHYAPSGANDIYSALILGEANSEGLSLAYVELCRQLGVPCQIVYGQQDRTGYCWNIIQIGTDYYHVDVALCFREGYYPGFLLPDETMWGRYRWDISSYPPCRGSLRYSDLFPDPV